METAWYRYHYYSLSDFAFTEAFAKVQVDSMKDATMLGIVWLLYVAFSFNHMATEMLSNDGRF